jgi:hypothetical protein
MKLVKFWILHEGTTTLDNIFETGGGKHVHGVNINFGKKRSRCCNDWWNKNLTSLAKLTIVTSANEPVNIGLHMGPPETFENNCTCCI